MWHCDTLFLGCNVTRRHTVGDMIPHPEMASYRSDAPYTSHPCLQRDPVLPIETQQPANQIYTGGLPGQSKDANFSKADYFSPSPHRYQNNSPYQRFYQDTTAVQRSEAGNPELSATPKPANHSGGFENLHIRDSVDKSRDKNDQLETRSSEKAEEPTESLTAVDTVKDTSSPLSTESLSDSEVPPKGFPDQDTGSKETDSPPSGQDDNYKQARYYKDYLKRYSEHTPSDGPNDRNRSDCSPESQKENCEPDKQSDDKDAEQDKEDSEKKVHPEEAVKETLDEVIRQHHFRVTQPLREQDSQPRRSSSPVQSDLPQSAHSGPRSEFTSPQLSPFPSAPRPPDFQRADSDPLSPRAAHIRHIQFSGEGSPPKRDFGPLGGPTFPHPGSGLPLHNPFLPQISQQLTDLHIQRSRANTLPTSDLLARQRSDSFSSLPEGRRKRDGADYYYCHLCSYVGTTDFHFQAHMNSHFEHQCPHCDYKSRTEGRLKRHIKDFHTEDNPPDFTGGRIMRREPGKPKLFRCRQCDFVAQEKEEYWKHARSHIKDDKCLQCPKCAFVTEYKHHLEYHLRNHFGSKPFKCNKCNYSCVNKSMLNSHMKSHTNVYQYRCADCTYATKYCHSLKLHLHKYNHKPAMVLNSDGSLPSDGLGDFDLVSKRGPPRGPRSMKRESNSPPGLEPVSNMLAHMHPMGPSNPLNGMQAMMSGFWPNGVAPPPPLIPVSGLPSLPLPQNLKPNHSPLGMVGEPPGRHVGGPRAIKCQLCDYNTDNPHLLMEHTIRVHGMDNSDLFDMFSANAMRRRDAMAQQKMEEARMGSHQDSLEAMRMLAHDAKFNATFRRPSSEVDCLDRSVTPPSPRPSSPHGNYARSPGRSPARSLSDFSPKSAASESHTTEKPRSTSQNGERPLDLTNVKLSPSLKRRFDDVDADVRNDVSDEQPRSAASANSEGGSVESGSQSRPTSPTPRKRSRKGNPFKLDAISMKLQTQYPAGSEENHEEVDESRDSYHSNDDKVEHSSVLHNNTKDSSHNAAKDPRNCFDDIQRKLSELDSSNSLDVMAGPRDSYSPPTPSQEDVPDTQEGAIDSMPMFSSSIDRRKILENFNRRESASPSGEIYQRDVRDGACDADTERHDDVQADSTKEEKWSKFFCHHCGIAFQDCIMYSIHSGYHGYKDPFQCNMCGTKTNDKVDFFLHIARKAHT